MVGDVVLTPFPFTDMSQAKIRPAVVVAYGGMDDWIICQITSTRRQDIQIALTQVDFVEGGLRIDSWVRPNRITTLNEGVFRRTLGRLSDEKQAEIAEAVRGLF